MRKYFLILTLTAFGCNSNQQSTKENKAKVRSDNCFEYPSMVDSLQLRDLYDSARWYVYTWHCDDKYLPKSDTSKSITFGELPLKFKDVAVKHDTVDVIFSFMDGHQSILPSMTRDVKELSTGVGFDMKTKTKIYMLGAGYSSTIKGGPNRYENPLQPEVIRYIKENWDKLDDCFRKLAEQKGIKE